MVKAIALDTNVAIDILNNEKIFIEKLSKVENIYLPAIVAGELLFGALNSGRSLKNLTKFKEFITSCSLLTINSTVAEEYAVIRKQLKDKGKPIPENDLWIAASCIVYQLPLATKDKHFKHVKTLQLIAL